jgi:hypothetical protein
MFALLSIPVLIAIVLTGEPMSFYEMVRFLVTYGVSLYIVIGDILLMGGANYLTKVRGEKWAKEIDYIYLFFGCLGVIGTVNRIEVISGRTTAVDLVGPLVLTTAIIFRLLKTRVEIGEWNKPAFKGVRVVPLNFDD